MISCDQTHRHHPTALAELLTEILVLVLDCGWLETPESPRLGVLKPLKFQAIGLQYLQVRLQEDISISSFFTSKVRLLHLDYLLFPKHKDCE